ncbi:MAG: NnrU family protein [Rhodospirillaceae bacterium]|nr:NnrU family protein [Rhodospirillales bacterium]
MTGGLWQLVLAVLVFLASHRLTNQPAFRRPAERVLGGKRGFTVAYSILSVLLLAWMIAAYGDAPMVQVWGQQHWMRWVPPLIMPVASILAAAGLTSPNPFSIGPGAKGYDPNHPGILRLTRHPVLWAAALWAGAHILPNGDVAALILFVPLLALAVVGPAMLERKRRRDLGGEWDRLAALTGKPSVVMLGEVGWKRVVGGLVLYAALVLLHQPVIGAWPLP